MRRADDGGSAIVEFVWLAVLLLVPLVYVVLTAVSVQRTAFGLTEAAREAARAYATAGSDSAGEQRAEAAAALALRDQGVRWSPSGRIVSCGDCSYAAGSTISVDLHVQVPLPLVPRWLCGGRCVAGIGVSAHHRERLDCFSGTGGQAATC
jgi:heme exporter protein D